METLRASTYRYDTTRALLDGDVTADGLELQMQSGATLIHVFKQLVDGEVDIAELGLTFYLRSLENGAPYVALPIFPNRVFRHSCIFVNTDAGIHTPEDLVGRTIGEFGMFGQDSGVWAKGILCDDYGFDPLANRWVIGGQEHPAPPFEFTTHPVPDDLDVTTAPADRSLAAMLEDGEIDALFTANVPQSVMDGTSKKIVRLFDDHVPVEQEWHARTGIYPMMHAVVIRRDVLQKDPSIAGSVYAAFLEAKNIATARYLQARRIFQAPTMLPWTNRLVEDTITSFGTDWFPYGLEANRKSLETYLRYHTEQGLSTTPWDVDDLFVADLLNT